MSDQSLDDAAFAEILDSAYAAAASYDLWPDALERMGALFGCSVVSLIERDVRTLKSGGTASGIDLAGQREYFAVWGARNPIVRGKRSWRAGEIDTDRQIVPKDYLVASDYYHAFMKPHDMHAIMRLTLNAGTSDDDGYVQVLNFGRPSSGGDFDKREIELARHLMPHAQRAGFISRRLQLAQVMLDSVTDVLERSPAGILLLDGLGRIAFANIAVRTMTTEDAFVLRRSRLEARDRRENTALQSLIDRATGHAPEKSTRGGAIRLSRESGKPGFNVVVAPLAAGQTCVHGGPVAFVLITDPLAAPSAGADILAQLFGFTGAESKVAERLLIGDSPEQAAAALDIRISTARWHLASLYRKTGTNRQAELVRLLSSVPMIRSQ